MNFSFLNYSRFLEFASDYLNNLNSYLKLGVFKISKNFEFARTLNSPILAKLSSREHFRIYNTYSLCFMENEQICTEEIRCVLDDN